MSSARSSSDMAPCEVAKTSSGPATWVWMMSRYPVNRSLSAPRSIEFSDEVRAREEASSARAVAATRHCDTAFSTMNAEPVTTPTIAMGVNADRAKPLPADCATARHARITQQPRARPTEYCSHCCPLVAGGSTIRA
ncbi:unannotated protein [freshwater metagenome]|uniref:Unannotated protein n=1 Tax=freshwater metagenome TaxID=449393 RepID=A0A6J7EUH6_9ZZZZ